MSWRDRPYATDDGYGQPELRIHLRKPSTAVTWLIVANVLAFFLDVLSRNFAENSAILIFGLSLNGVKRLFLWQPVSYMFMHASVFHLLFNMIGLYIFGCEFERTFGRERFLQFYAICGIVGGIAYLLLSLIDRSHAVYPLIGASGAVYGLLIAAIIFFPHIQIILIIFPMPIRVFGLIIAAILLLKAISPGGVENLGGEVCHVTGAATGLAIFYVWGIMPKIRLGGGRGSSITPSEKSTTRRRFEGAWDRKQKQLAAEQVEVDHILAKVHEQGLRSLTRKEKKTLNRATQRQKEHESRAGRIDKL